MSVLGGPAQAGEQGPTGMGIIVGVVLILVSLGIAFVAISMGGMLALIGIIVGGVLVAFGVHLVPVGGAPAAMGQVPGIATGVPMLAAGAGLAGLFKGAWAAETGYASALGTGAIGGALLMAISMLMVNIIYVYGMGIPAASGKVDKDPITGDTFPEYKTHGTEGHGLPFISYVGGVFGGLLGGFGGTLIYLMMYDVYLDFMPATLGASVEEIMPIAVGLAGVFAIGIFLINAVLSAYNIGGTIEGPHDPKFKRFPRAIIGSAVASAIAGVFVLLIAVLPAAL
ncbi:n5-methyltetrahydromethanopterin:coenzyme m methyltransferase subunit d [hydrocarbon metagenome]|uniref:N5-methyltetrahydromethanopterin:coenzyme m methyltransferase subunit d n=1 Tax=hydrocarbon metagenome TaxID=938273 RepID=A0A0W8FIZ3_9ZZZZ